MIEDFLKEHGKYYNNKSFRQLTTLKMGGHISHLVYPKSIEDTKEIIHYLRNNHIDFKVIGNGSNLVCGESRYDGVVVCLKLLNNYSIEGEEVYAQSGVLAPYLANVLAKVGLSGFEFASSIPGVIGGLTFMNAGAYRSSMSDILSEVTVLKNDEIVTMKVEELKMSYRRSIFQEHPHWVILAVKMKLKKADVKEILELMNDRLIRRQESQPLDKPSAGSCFRNPEGNFAWQLIDEIGMRGYEQNGIIVSSKHPNFIINDNSGNAKDYLDIVYRIQDEVFKRYGIKLVLEVEKFNC